MGSGDIWEVGSETWSHVDLYGDAGLSQSGSGLKLLPPLDRRAVVLLEHCTSKLWLRSEHPDHYTQLKNTACAHFTRIDCCNVAMHFTACHEGVCAAHVQEHYTWFDSVSDDWEVWHLGLRWFNWYHSAYMEALTYERLHVYDLSFPSSVAYLDVLLSQQNLCRNTEDNNTNTPRRVH